MCNIDTAQLIHIQLYIYILSNNHVICMITFSLLLEEVEDLLKLWGKIERLQKRRLLLVGLLQQLLPLLLLLLLRRLKDPVIPLLPSILLRLLFQSLTLVVEMTSTAGNTKIMFYSVYFWSKTNLLDILFWNALSNCIEFINTIID